VYSGVCASARLGVGKMVVSAVLSSGSCRDAQRACVIRVPVTVSLVAIAGLGVMAVVGG